MTDRELMQQALEALEDACGGRCNAENNPCWQRDIANALRDRLAQPEQEPVAWMSIGVIVKSEIPQFYTGPLYLTSSQRPWVGLEQSDMPEGESPMFDHQYFIAGMAFAAKVLEEKNT